MEPPGETLRRDPERAFGTCETVLHPLCCPGADAPPLAGDRRGDAAQGARGVVGALPRRVAGRDGEPLPPDPVLREARDPPRVRRRRGDRGVRGAHPRADRVRERGGDGPHAPGRAPRHRGPQRRRLQAPRLPVPPDRDPHGPRPASKTPSESSKLTFFRLRIERSVEEGGVTRERAASLVPASPLRSSLSKSR